MLKYIPMSDISVGYNNQIKPPPVKKILEKIIYSIKDGLKLFSFRF
jgi:hypothetical protein